ESEARSLREPHGALSRLSRLVWQKVFRQYNVGWHPQILRKTGNIYLDGYWQSPKYFEDIRETILEDFSLREPLSEAARLIADDMAASNSVSILVRRGDYVTNKKA